MTKYKIIAVLGMSGSGKSSLISQTVKKYPKYFNKIITSTTRPMRDEELNGIDYYFYKNPQEFFQQDLIEYACFNNWFYGTSITALDANKINIGTFNPAGYRLLQACENIDVIPILLIASDKERLLRQLKREENPNVDEIMRRWKTDKEDFKDITGYWYENEKVEDGVAFPQFIAKYIDNWPSCIK